MHKINKSNIYSQLKKDFSLSIKIMLIITAIIFMLSGKYTFTVFFETLYRTALYTFILALGQGTLNNLITSKWDWVDKTNKRVWAGIIFTVLYTIPAILFIHYLLFVVMGNLPKDRFFTQRYIWIHLFGILFSFTISSFLHAREFMIAWKKSSKKETQKQKIVAKTETAKFESLKNQLDPHFLFNSLNVLTSLIGENPALAEKFTTKLSKVYRYVLEQRNKDLVPITEELAFAKTYMELLMMRFEGAIEFKILEIADIKELKIVPLSLQLLLENAVKHNVVSSTKPLKITIYKEDNYLLIENNLNPKEAIGKSTKIGLQNIADRYGLICDKEVKITNNNTTFKVSLPLLNKINNNMNTDNLEDINYIKATEKVEKLKQFYKSLVSYCLVIPFLIFINLKFSTKFQWFWFPLFGWGIGLVFRYLDLKNYNMFFGKDWEDKKVKEFIEKEKSI